MEKPFEWKEFNFRIDSRILTDLRERIALMSMLGKISVVEAAWIKIFKAMDEGNTSVDIRYKSDDPSFHAD